MTELQENLDHLRQILIRDEELLSAQKRDTAEKKNQATTEQCLVKQLLQSLYCSLGKESGEQQGEDVVFTVACGQARTLTTQADLRMLYQELAELRHLMQATLKKREIFTKEVGECQREVEEWLQSHQEYREWRQVEAELDSQRAHIQDVCSSTDEVRQRIREAEQRLTELNRGVAENDETANLDVLRSRAAELESLPTEEQLRSRIDAERAALSEDRRKLEALKNQLHM